MFILHLLLAEVHRIIGLYNILVCLGIEFLIINTIDDPPQIMASRTEQTVQTLPVEGGLDLLRICFTYGSHRISKYDTTL